ncbi:MAG: adenosine deaminase [Eubacteriales bacterium]|nr:adenosine deaminase [Eubacteriales bacterium]
MREKADLHLHLDGSLSVSLVQRLLAESGETPDTEQLKNMLMVPADCRNLTDYLKCFDLPVRILQSRQALCAAGEDLTERLGKQGLTYAEIRFAPQLHTERGLTQEMAVEAVSEGIGNGLKKCPGLRAGLLLCMMVTGEPKANEETAELACALKGQGVAGLDLAGAEGAVPMETFRPFFRKAYAMDVPFTIHAGECGDYENIRTAVSFGARRIGHGCAAQYSEECMELLKREGILLEMCPTSNLQTRAVNRIGEHPIRKFFDRGIRVSVNTDNMTVSCTDLEQEYALLKTAFGFTENEIRQMNQWACEAGFAHCTSTTKNKFLIH